MFVADVLGHAAGFGDGARLGAFGAAAPDAIGDWNAFATGPAFALGIFEVARSGPGFENDDAF